MFDLFVRFGVRKMATFIPFEYGRKKYPGGIVCPIEEVAGHFDKSVIRPRMAYSLHSEFAYASREWDSERIQEFPILLASQEQGIPMLWTSIGWAEEFADFLIRLVGGHAPPEIIEIHPPFLDACPDIPAFLERFLAFERSIHAAFPGVRICLENRAGTQYKRSEFLVSSIDSVRCMLETIDRQGLPLSMVLDYPQFFTAEDYNLANFPLARFRQQHDALSPFRKYIAGIHIWGRRGAASHVGDLDDLFCGDIEAKRGVLRLLNEFYEDCQIRYFVPEVNGAESDLQSIVQDFLEAGAVFHSEPLSSATTERSIRIIDWNLSFFHPTEPKLDELERLVQGRECILLLQEVTPETRKSLSERFGSKLNIAYSLDHRPPGRFDQRSRYLGVAICTTSGISIRDSFVLDRAPLPDRTLVAKLDIGGSTLRAMCLHSVTGVDYYKTKALQFFSFAEAIEMIRPDIVGIDANEPGVDSLNPDEVEYYDNGDKGRGAKTFFGTMRDVGLQDALAFSPDVNRDDKATLPYSYIVNKSKARKRYDFVYASTDHLKVISTEYKVGPLNDNISDHAPICIVTQMQ